MQLILRAYILTASILCLTDISLASGPVQNDGETWKLSDLYASPADWEASYTQTNTELTSHLTYKKRENCDASCLADKLDATSSLHKKVARLYSYASLERDQDLRVQEAESRFKKVASLGLKLESLTSKNTSLILNIGRDHIETFIDQLPDRLEKHTFALRDTFKRQPRAPKVGTAQAIARLTQIRREAAQQFSRKTGAIQWPVVTLSSGNAALLDPRSYAYYRAVPQATDRYTVFNAYWKAVSQHTDRLASSLNQVIKTNAQIADMQGYPSTLHHALSTQDIPIAAYQTLIKEANSSLPTLHRYLKAKQKLLGSARAEYSDIYANFQTPEPRFTLSDAKRLTSKATSAFGAEYLKILQKGFTGRWMHAFPQEGKRAGAYMQDSAYGTHPYILLNFTGSYEGVATFSHEWGHAVHSVLSQRNNPYETARYGRAIAEFVGTTNEFLLQRHMLDATKIRSEQLFYADRALSKLHEAFFRHAMYAEFEQSLYQAKHSEQPLTAAQINALYLTLLRKYYGHSEGVVTVDTLYAVEWAIAPFFYDPFSIYRYATATAASSHFTARLKKNKRKLAEQYLKMLRAGGSQYPHALLQNMGIDLTSPTPYQALTAYMSKLVDQLEALSTQPIQSN